MSLPAELQYMASSRGGRRRTRTGMCSLLAAGTACRGERAVGSVSRVGAEGTERRSHSLHAVRMHCLGGGVR